MDQYAYNSDLDELSMEEEEPSRGGVLRKRKKSNTTCNDDSRFKSKNLTAERRRRAKLNDRLLQLRTLMTKANIIKDAITYIEELKTRVEELSEELLELEETHHHVKEEFIKPIRDDDQKNAAQEMKNWGVEPEVKVIPIDDDKVWMKVVYPKRLGGLTKLVEGVTNLGFEFNDTNLTTSKGAAILTSCLEVTISKQLGFGTYNGRLDIEETKELLQNITSSMI
ncbi:hypothetical protein Cgig2_031387 [Carnegiea gigantea]|uniref:BHLH domain-containing protein n=1 Tax=Carnegiea gigantea TaxID=171969 RepID=A0A9Q1K7P3_9CARY|nr:hypothetical protein Cgig2_031387 [Carnegiea gigantea]